MTIHIPHSLPTPSPGSDKADTDSSSPSVSAPLSSQIAAVNGGHAPTDDAVPSGDKSTATLSMVLS